MTVEATTTDQLSDTLLDDTGCVPSRGPQGPLGRRMTAARNLILPQEKEVIGFDRTVPLLNTSNFGTEAQDGPLGQFE